MLTDPAIYPSDTGQSIEAPVSAISWSAIIGGAVAAAAATLVLILLGSGLGLSSISPWPGAGVSAATFTITAGVWLIAVQWISSGLGGFITGRLRTKWVRVHTHEVFFRDTAHGLLTWGLASVIGAMVLASAGSSAVGTTTRAASTIASSAVANAGRAGGTSDLRAYNIDTLFRGERTDLAGSDSTAHAEAARIFANSALSGEMSEADRTYLSGQIAARTGLSQADAQKRLDDVIAREKAAETKARQAADTARKSTAAIAIFTALSMLIGAFIASAAAAYGGSLRDEYP